VTPAVTAPGDTNLTELLLTLGRTHAQAAGKSECLLQLIAGKGIRSSHDRSFTRLFSVSGSL